MKNLRKVNLKGKRVLVRCDFNVPLSKRGDILDDFKIKKVLPTIQYLMKSGAKVILMSHLGRPDGKVVKELRLAPVQKKLTEYLGIPVVKTAECLGPEVEAEIAKMQPGQVILLENVQFYPGEKQNNQGFAKSLAGLADIFVMEAFGQAHRNYASIAGIAKYLPSFPGFLVEKEIRVLKAIMKNPEKPLTAIVGGVKVETKAALINKVSEKADYVLVGGLISKEIKKKDIYINYPRKIIGPVDETGGGKDIGPKTIKLFNQKILLAKTIFFNGVLGQIEDKRYAKGTEEILKTIVKSGAFSVIGGGDTVEFVNLLGLDSKFNHISTGGGAMIAFLAGEKLPGIEALK